MADILTDTESIRSTVRERYGRIAEAADSEGCGPGCCSPSTAADAARISQSIGYSDSDVATVPEGANLGLGCGNPVALAQLEPGMTVLDLGSGAGFDAFLAAQQVGPTGQVIGVDMTPEMLSKARANANSSNTTNVEFRLGEIEHLPVETGTIDAILSNCVINLSVDKPQVFREAHRVLREGGKLMVSDIVLESPLPAPIAQSFDAYVGCVAGAMLQSDYLQAIRDAGFHDVEVMSSTTFGLDCVTADPTAAAATEALSQDELQAAAASVRSISVRAVR